MFADDDQIFGDACGRRKSHVAASVGSDSDDDIVAIALGRQMAELLPSRTVDGGK